MGTVGPFFKTQGTLGPDAFYVERAADLRLFEVLKAGEFAYVLAPRQMGKSSLCVRTVRKLVAEVPELRAVTIDLTKIGKSLGSVTEETWYLALLFEITISLKLENPQKFWAAHTGLPPAQRWFHFIRDVLGRIPGRLVVFIDEINLTESLDFDTDDFFAMIRAASNGRADDEIWARITFCLLGISSPSELIKDLKSTPFNVGHRVDLEDFTFEQLSEFRRGLFGLEDTDKLLKDVFEWTHGQPYMSQCVFEALTSPRQREAKASVDELVEQLFLRRGRVDDQNLAFAERHFADDVLDPRKPAMLRLYRDLMENHLVAANIDDPVQQALRLTGMIATRSVPPFLVPMVAVRNRIFERVFDLAWVHDQESRRQLLQPVNAWLSSGKRDDFLVVGAALQQANEWASSCGDLSQEESAFLRASAARHSNRNTLRLAGAFAILLVGLIALLVAGLLREARVANEKLLLELDQRDKAVAIATAEQKASALQLRIDALSQENQGLSDAKALLAAKAEAGRVAEASQAKAAAALKRLDDTNKELTDLRLALTEVRSAWSDSRKLLAATETALKSEMEKTSNQLELVKALRDETQVQARQNSVLREELDRRTRLGEGYQKTRAELLNQISVLKTATSPGFEADLRRMVQTLVEQTENRLLAVSSERDRAVDELRQATSMKKKKAAHRE